MTAKYSPSPSLNFLVGALPTLTFPTKARIDRSLSLFVDRPVVTPPDTPKVPSDPRYPPLITPTEPDCSGWFWKNLD